MIERAGDIWIYAYQGNNNRHWIAITTNGVVNARGANVMGRGIAKQAADRYAGLPRAIGRDLQAYGNVVRAFESYRLLTFPVKYHWRDPASLELIKISTLSLVKIVDELALERIYMVRPGCGNGGLRWETVKPVIAPQLDDRFVIVERP